CASTAAARPSKPSFCSTWDATAATGTAANADGKGRGHPLRVASAPGWRPRFAGLFRVPGHAARRGARELDPVGLGIASGTGVDQRILRLVGERIAQLALDLATRLGRVRYQPVDCGPERVGRRNHVPIAELAHDLADVELEQRLPKRRGRT